MAKTKAQKEAEVREYAESLKGSSSVVFADLTGLKVNESSGFRRKAEDEGVSVRMAKKTLFSLALKKAGLSDIDEAPFGNKSITMIMSSGDQVAPSKLLASLLKGHEGMAAIGGLLDGKWMAAEEVTAFAKLPSRDELIAKVVGSVGAPLSGLVGVLQGNIRNFVYTLNAIRESKS